MRTYILVAELALCATSAFSNTLNCGSQSVAISSSASLPSTITCTISGGSSDGGLTQATVFSSVYGVLPFFYAAWGGLTYLNLNPEGYTGPKVTLSANWGDTFHLPSSPAGDYFDVTRFISYSVAGDININGNDYTRQDDIHYSPSVYPDPNLPNTTGRLFTIQESIAGPISIHTKGSWQVTLDPSDCCLQNGPNVYLFEQVLQIERFHPDGTLDPLSTPEPTSCALMGSGLLCGFGFLRLRKARRN